MAAVLEVVHLSSSAFIGGSIVSCRCSSAPVCGLIIFLGLVSPLHAWPGHDWAQWKRTTTWTKPDIKTDQAGKKELVPLLAVGGETPGRIDEIKAWEQRRSRIAGTITRILGEPNKLEVLPPEVEVLGEETLDDHVRRHIRIRSEPDDWIPAYLLLPKKCPELPSPAMICLHQTVARGKQEPCGIQGSEDLAFALELVRKGYICIAPDVIGFGERIPAGGRPYHDSIAFYEKHPRWSFMGKMIWDVGRVIDYLETLPYVDRLQIGSIGHSHGAYGTLFAAAFEPRLSLAIASCGFTTFRSDPQPDRWSHRTALIPQLGTYLPDVQSIPFDWHQVCSLIAPRPLFVWYATKDSIFPNTSNLDALFKDVRTVYGLYGAADDLAWRAFDGPHCFPDAGRDLAYQWLGQRFFPVGDIRSLPGNLADWQERRQIIRRVIRRSIGAPAMKPPPFDLKTLATGQLDAYERCLIEYAVEKGERVEAYLCVPKVDRRPLPAVLVLHQTSPEGKGEAAGITGDGSLAFAADLAGRGYVTLAPDSITAGERIDRFGAFDTRGYYLRHPDLSAMGKMLYDARRAVDLLVHMEGVDPNRIGAVGHSLGAEVALMLAAFDERVQATVSSCGYATFEAERNRLRWARDHWFSYMPKLRPVFLRGQLPHWDWGDVIRLVAPRSFYQHTAREDNIFPESHSAQAAGEAARVIWQLYGQPDRLVNVLKPGKHAISHQAKAEAYNWLDHQLKSQP